MDKNTKTELNRALFELAPYYRKAAIFGILASFLILMPSIYMLEVYDRVINTRSYLTLGMLTIFVLGAIVLMEMLEMVRSQILLKASIAFDSNLNERVFKAIYYGNLRRISGCSQEAMRDYFTLRDFLYAPVVSTLFEIPTAFLMIIILFVVSPILGWAAIVGALLQTLLAWLNQNKIGSTLSEANNKSIAAQQYADSTRRSAAHIQAMGMLKNIYCKWSKKHTEFIDLQSKASEAAGFYQTAVKFIQNVVASALLGLGAWLLLRDQLNGGAGYMIFGSILGGRAVSPVVLLVTQWQVVLNAQSAYKRLDEMLVKTPVQMPTMPLPVPSGKLNVESIVVYASSNRSAILKGVSFSLEPSEVLAVIGPSTAGKTILAKTLVGLWPTASGKVRLDGADIYDWNKSELGPHVGYLPQEISILEGTIAENIARFGIVDQSEVQIATNLVGLHDFVMSLPLGYATPVGMNGQLLSGGQRQRVGLARAFYRRPTYVVLDEPNSNLDDEGDSYLEKAIFYLKSRGTTFVVMTHRPTVLEISDKVLFLKEGQAFAYGPRDVVTQRQYSAPIVPKSTLEQTEAHPLAQGIVAS